MTNKQLDLCICEIATGNREALRQLYDEFKNPIFLFDLSILKNYQAAEDVEQDTFLNIMQSACKYRPGTNAKAWIFSITRNCCSDYLKTNTKYVPLEADILASFPTERTIVSLYIFWDFKQTEIAKILKIPYRTVRDKYSYAIKKMKGYFGKKGVRNNEKKNSREFVETGKRN